MTKEIDVSTDASVNSLPTFNAIIYGIEDKDAYFLLTFENSNTVVWGIDCVQGEGYGMNLGAPCSDRPVNLKTSYNASSNPHVELFGNFTNLTFTGYQVSGAIWKNEICFAGICRIGLVYEATTIDENNWYLNTTKDSAYGVIGMGPISPFWDAYIDAEE